MKSLKQCLQTLCSAPAATATCCSTSARCPTADRAAPGRAAEGDGRVAGQVRREHLRHARRAVEAHQGLASTRQGNTIFLHVLRWDGDSVTLPDIPAQGPARHGADRRQGDVQAGRATSSSSASRPRASRRSTRSSGSNWTARRWTCRPLSLPSHDQGHRLERVPEAGRVRAGDGVRRRSAHALGHGRRHEAGLDRADRGPGASARCASRRRSLPGCRNSSSSTATGPSGRRSSPARAGRDFKQEFDPVTAREFG